MSTFAAPAPAPAHRELPYAIVDVFAERPLTGNPLAIFTDARGLSTAQMQALARETNLCETTFVLPRDPALEIDDGVSVRIFTTEEELPFAGHPTLGTASWLYKNHPGLRDAETVHLRLAAGRIAVRFETPVPGDLGVFGTMRQNDPVFGAVHSRDQVAAALGLSPQRPRSRSSAPDSLDRSRLLRGRAPITQGGGAPRDPAARGPRVSGAHRCKVLPLHHPCRSRELGSRLARPHAVL